MIDGSLDFTLRYTVHLRCRVNLSIYSAFTILFYRGQSFLVVRGGWDRNSPEMFEGHSWYALVFRNRLLVDKVNSGL